MSAVRMLFCMDESGDFLLPRDRIATYFSGFPRQFAADNNMNRLRLNGIKTETFGPRANMR